MTLLKPTPPCPANDAADDARGDTIRFGYFFMADTIRSKRPDRPDVAVRELGVRPLFPTQEGPVCDLIGNIISTRPPSKVGGVYTSQVTVSARVDGKRFVFGAGSMLHGAHNAMRKGFPGMVKNWIAVLHSGKWPYDARTDWIGSNNLLNKGLYLPPIWRGACERSVSLKPIVVLTAKTFSKVLSVAIFDRACSMVLGHIGTFSSYVCRLGLPSQLAYPSNTGRMSQVGVA